MGTQRVLFAAVFVLWASSASATMTCTATDTSAMAAGTSTTAVAAMPTAAPTNATLWAAVLNRTDLTTAVTGTAGSVNTTGWANSSPYDNSFGAGVRSWYAYKVGATTGTDTVTVTFAGSISWQIVVGWCADSSGSAQTFDAEASGTSFNTGATNYDSNTAAATGAGGILGFIFTLASQTSGAPVADGANETRISGAAASRTHALFEPYASSGTYGIEATIQNASAGNMMVIAFLNPAAAGCTGGVLLLGAGKCDE